MSYSKLINEFLDASPQALLDTKVVSAYTGLSISWFHCKAVLGGGIPYSKIGNKRRYLKQDVLDWLAEHTKKVRSTSEYDKKAVVAFAHDSTPKLKINTGRRDHD